MILRVASHVCKCADQGHPWPWRTDCLWQLAAVGDTGALLQASRRLR